MFIEVMIVALLAGMSPGPDFFLVMKNSLGYGRKVGIASALGIAAALAVHASYTILGLAIIIRSFHYIFIIIQILGAIYLAYLGVCTLLSTFKCIKLELDTVAQSTNHKSCLEGFVNGFVCNILNPKAIIFFLSIFSQFMAPGTLRWVEWVYGIEVVLVIGAWFVLLSRLISSNVIFSFYQKCRIWLESFFGVILICYAVRICKTAFGDR